MVHVSLLTMLICSVYMHVRDFWSNGNYSRHGEVAMGIQREMNFVEVEDIVLQFCLVYMEVSKNPFWGSPIHGNTHMNTYMNTSLIIH